MTQLIFIFSESFRKEDTTRKVSSVLGLVLLAALPAVADAPQTGVVTGVVTDPDGGVLPGVTVQLIGEQGTMTAIRKSDGSFRFVFMAPGTYTAFSHFPVDRIDIS
jgi:hypothetical protein